MLLQSSDVEVKICLLSSSGSGLIQEITATLNELEHHQNIEVSGGQIQIKGSVKLTSMVANLVILLHFARV